MKRIIQIAGVSAFLLFASFYSLPQVGAQGGSPNTECGSNTFLVKLDGIPDLEPGQTYTGTVAGTDGVTYTITVQFNGPNDYTLLSAAPALPANAIFVPKFGEGGGFSHLTVCVPLTTVNMPTPMTEIVTTPTPATEGINTPMPTTEVVNTTTTTTVLSQPTAVPATTVPSQLANLPTTVPGEQTTPPQVAQPTTPGKAAPTIAVVTAMPSTGQGPDDSNGQDGMQMLMFAGVAILAGTAAIIVRQQRSER